MWGIIHLKLIELFKTRPLNHPTFFNAKAAAPLFEGD